MKRQRYKQLIITARIGFAVLLVMSNTPRAHSGEGTGGYCYQNQFPDTGGTRVTNNCSTSEGVCTGTCTKVVPTIPAGTVCEACVGTKNIFKQCFTSTATSVSAVTYTAGCTWEGSWPWSSCVCGSYGSIPTPPTTLSCGQVSHGTTSLTKSDAC